MPSPILHQGATVLCSHGGQAAPTTASPKVFVSGMPIVTITTTYSISGCPFAPPCVTGQWIVGSGRVLSDGQPVAIMSGVSICAPSDAPMAPVQAQTLVLAT